jgi:hypothetical protein
MMLLLSLFLAAAVPEKPLCASISGWDQVLSKKGARYLVLGEMHGTNEMPQVFADAVCLTSQERAVVVALELPQTDQPQIDAWLESDGGEDAKRALLTGPFWNGDFKDGRSSGAMFALLDQLRLFYSAGAIRGVVAFQPTNIPNPWSEEAYEKAMARLISDNTPKGATALVLVGNIHAMRTPLERQTVSYLPMAGHLPVRKTLSLNVENDGGFAWACTGPKPANCGPLAIGKEMGLHKRGVTLSGKAGDTYDGTLYLGKSATASPPQGNNAKLP